MLRRIFGPKWDEVMGEWKNYMMRILDFFCILLGISPASDYGLPTFRNTLSVPSSKAGCEV